MHRPSPRRSTLCRLLTLCALLAALPAFAQKPGASRPGCDQLRATREAVLADLRSGQYCKVCLRTRTEFQQSQQNFEAHFKKAENKRGTGSAPANVFNLKTQYYDHLIAERCGSETGAAPGTSGPQAQSCAALYDYRDHELFHEWDKAVAKVSIYSQARSDMQRQREKLLNDARWQTSDWTLMRAELAKVLESTSELVLNLLELHPAGAAAGRVIKSGKTTAAKVYQALEDGKKIKKITDGELTEVVWDEVLSTESLPAAKLRKSAKTFKDMAKAVKEMHEFKEQHEELKSIMREELDRVDAAIDEQEANLKRSRRAMEALEAIKQGIDSYCLEQSRKPAPAPRPPLH